MQNKLISLLYWSIDHYWNFVTGIFLAFLAYFADIKGAFHVMFAAFLIDLILGIWASRKARKEKFNMKKFWIAWERMLISYAIIMLLFAMDKEMKQDTVSLANIASWIISGFLAYSAAENGFEITGGKIFIIIKSFLKKKVEDNTGVDLDNNKTELS